MRVLTILEKEFINKIFGVKKNCNRCYEIFKADKNNKVCNSCYSYLQSPEATEIEIKLNLKSK